MSWSDFVTYKGDYFGLDEVFYNWGGTEVVDNTKEAASTVVKTTANVVTETASKVKAGVMQTIDVVKGPIESIGNFWEVSTGLMKWAALAVFGLGFFWLASKLNLLVQIHSILRDVMNLVGHFR